MPRLMLFQGQIGGGPQAMPPVPPSSQDLVSSLGQDLGTLVVNGVTSMQPGVQGVQYPSDPSMTPQSAGQPTSAPGAASAASPPAQGGKPSLGSQLGRFAMGAIFGGAGANPQRSAEAQKAIFDLRERADTIRKGDAASAEMTQVMRDASAQMKSVTDPAQRHAILADAITQASLIGQKYQVPPSMFANGFTQFLNANDPDGTLAAAFMNGTSGKPQGNDTFYNEGQRTAEAKTASDLKKQEEDASYKQALDVQGSQNTGAANVANITGGYGVKEAGIHAGAEVKAAGIGAGATIKAAGISQAGENSRNAASLAASAPLRNAQVNASTAAAQDSVTNVMTKLAAGSGVPNQDVPAVVSRATRYAATGETVAQSVSHAISDLHRSAFGQGTMTPYVPPRAAAPRPAGGKTVIRFDAQGNPIL